MRARCGSGTGRGIWQRAGRAGGVGRAEVGERGRVSGAGPCGRETGRWEKEDWAEGKSGPGLLKGLGFSYFLSLFYFKHHSNYLNSNSNLNSTLTLKQKEKMHQHECNNKF